MTLFKTTDNSGAESIHNCNTKETAKQAHLLHFGLISANFSNVKIIYGNIEPCLELSCLSYIEELDHKDEIK